MKNIPSQAFGKGCEELELTLLGGITVDKPYCLDPVRWDQHSGWDPQYASPAGLDGTGRNNQGKVVPCRF